MNPSIHIFTLDCLRESSSTRSVTPFLRSLPIQWSRGYSSGTWTLPSHASLFSGQSPIKHGITRPNDTLTETAANLPRVAQENGYTTAIFSENPTFSSETGFDLHIDSTHDYIHRKLLLSEFSPFGYVNNVNLKEGVSLAKEILSRRKRLRNIINTGYGAYHHFSNRDKPYPHHGERVFSHLVHYLQKQPKPILTVTNILDPHNPYHGKPPSAEGSRSHHEIKALRAGDDNRNYLLTNEAPPKDVRTVHGDWETFFNAQERVYKEYAHETDHLLKKWDNEEADCFNDGLIVILGDHGQLFGSEGMVGHHTSLHPHGIHVPIAIDPPSGWNTFEQTFNTPVSIAGIGRALIDIVAGDINTTERFIEAIKDHSREYYKRVPVCADGPTWSIPSLFQDTRFDDDLIEELAVRRVALVGDENVDVYKSNWNEKEVEKTSYNYTKDSRDLAGVQNS